MKEVNKIFLFICFISQSLNMVMNMVITPIQISLVKDETHGKFHFLKMQILHSK